MEERRNHLEFKEFYNKETGGKIRCIRGYEIIEAYFENPEISLFGRKVKKHQHPIAELGSYFAIDYTGVIHGNDYIIVKDGGDLEVVNEKAFELIYTKNKRIRSKFLKIEKEFTTAYIELDTISNVEFIKKENEKYIHISHETGWEIINPERALNYDEVEEILKNYVEE